MKKKVKFRDITIEQYKELVGDEPFCKIGICKTCPFLNVLCSSLLTTCWVNHKDLYSDKFLDQEIEIDVPDILDEKEKAYLSAVIKPFRDRVNFIRKMSIPDCREQYLVISVRVCQFFALPNFDKDTMYAGMEPDKKYTLEELGL